MSEVPGGWFSGAGAQNVEGADSPLFIALSHPGPMNAVDLLKLAKWALEKAKDQPLPQGALIATDAARDEVGAALWHISTAEDVARIVAENPRKEST